MASNYDIGGRLILSNTGNEKGELKFYRTSAKEGRLKDPNDVLCHAFREGSRTNAGRCFVSLRIISRLKPNRTAK